MKLSYKVFLNEIEWVGLFTNYSSSPAVPVNLLDTPSLGFTEQEIDGAAARERDMSVPSEIALPPTCMAQLQVPIIVDGTSFQQAPSLSTSHQDWQLALPRKDAESKKRKRECMEDKIDEMHLIVLTKESKKLDMEVENLLLEREKLQLEIKKIKVKLLVINYGCQFWLVVVVVFHMSY